MIRLMITLLIVLQFLQANNEKSISFLDFIELLSVHNNINIFVDENATKNISFFVPERVNPKDYFDIFKISMKKDGYDVVKKGDIYFLEKIQDIQSYPYLLSLKNNSFEDVLKYLKFKKLEHEYISASNRFLVYTYPNQYQGILKDIQSLDVQKKQVSLKFTIIEISDDDIESLGFNTNASTTSSDIKSVLSALLTPQDTSKLVFNSKHFNSVLNLYNQSKQLKIIQNPFILVQDRTSFNFQAVTNIPFKVSQKQSSSTINSVETSIEYKDVGLKIFGTAFINDKTINLDLNLSVEDILSITNEQPTTYKRFLKSNTNLKRGEVLLLSGLKQTKLNKDTLSIPFISNIPYLGELFKYNYESNVSSNISIAIEVLNDYL